MDLIERTVNLETFRIKFHVKGRHFYAFKKISNIYLKMQTFRKIHKVKILNSNSHSLSIIYLSSENYC